MGHRAGWQRHKELQPKHYNLLKKHVLNYSSLLCSARGKLQDKKIFEQKVDLSSFVKQTNPNQLEVLIEVTHSFHQEGNPAGPANGKGQKTEHITKQFSLVLLNETNTNHNLLNTILCYKVNCFAKPFKHLFIHAYGQHTAPRHALLSTTYGGVQVRMDQVTHTYYDIQQLPASWRAVGDSLHVLYMYISVNVSSHSKQQTDHEKVLPLSSA